MKIKEAKRILRNPFSYSGLQVKKACRQMLNDKGCKKETVSISRPFGSLEIGWGNPTVFHPKTTQWIQDVCSDVAECISLLGEKIKFTFNEVQVVGRPHNDWHDIFLDWKKLNEAFN